MACVAVEKHWPMEFIVCLSWLPNFFFPLAFSDFLAGSVAGMAATVSTYPFDILRTRLAAQSYPVVSSRPIYWEIGHNYEPTNKRLPQRPNQVYHSMSEGAKAILAKEGFRGFFRGVWTSL